MEVSKKVESYLVGYRLKNVLRRDHDWVFSFDNDVAVSVETSWRIVTEGHNRLGDCDHGQQFGLPAPVDSPKLAEKLLQNMTVRQISIRKETGDLTIAFDGETFLEVIHISAGYEGWNLSAGRLQVMAQGGGELAIWER